MGAGIGYVVVEIGKREGVGVEIELDKSKRVWGKWGEGKSELDKSNVELDWLGGSIIWVVIGSIGWETEGKRSV